MSRAKSLLILIGNAKTLSINPDYEYIIKECQRHQTLIGGMDHGPSSETDQSEANRKNNAKIKHSNNKKKNEATIDMVNKTLQDLKLQNKNANTNRANRNKRRQRVGGKNNKAEENKENKHFDNKDCSDDDDDDDDDDNDSDKDDDDDDKPSTSKAAGKPHLSQSMKKSKLFFKISLKII